MNYSQVQFISWEINSGPKTVYDPKSFVPKNLGSYYPGICSSAIDNRFDVLSQCQDIDARVKFTEAAIKAAQQSSNLDKSSSTLKVFMAPEFLYRGAGGAYLHDLINGWAAAAPADFALDKSAFASKWSGLFGGLQALVADDAFKDWVFVFGTAISASFATNLVPSPRTPDSKAIIDLSKPAEIYNSALVQLGGKANTSVNYASRKHYISHIDFLKNYFYSNITFLKDGVAPLDPNTIKSVVETGPEGGALFNLSNVNDNAGKPLNFGLEICLDHAASGGLDPKTNWYTNRYGRIRNANKYVKLQLIPSAGMSLVDASIRLEPGTASTPNSYAFNCDGLGNLNNTSGSHTQVWNGANGAAVPPANKLFEASGGAALTNTVVTAVANSVNASSGNVAATTLWSNGAGSVRVIKPLSL